jgi:TolB-like protein
MRLACVALVLAGASVAQAATDGGTPTVALLDFQANPQALAHAAPLTALIASDLAKAPQVHVITQGDITTALGLERQKQILGGECDDSCRTELSQALGSRYVVSGRVDAFGPRLVVTASVFDAQRAVSLAKPRADVASSDELPAAAATVSRALLFALGVTPPPEVPLAPSIVGATAGPTVALKVGPQFFEALASLNFEADLELGYRFEPEWIGFLEIGFTLVRSDVEQSRVTVLPTVLGARHLYRVDKDLQPYWGLGLGVQLAFGTYGIFQSTGPLPTVLAMLGLQYMLTQHFAVGLESRTNLSETILGIAQGTSGSAGNGFNLDLVGTLTWRF